MKYKFKLLRIHCAGCAVALEQKVNEIEGVDCSINFVTKDIMLDISTPNPSATLEEVKDVIKKFDSMIQIVDNVPEDEEEKREKREKICEICKLVLAVVILISGVLVKIFWLKVVIFALDYLLVSYKVLISAAKNIVHGKIFDENFLMSIASIGAFIIQEFTEAIFVMLLFDVGEILEDFAVDKSKKTIKNLLEIKQPFANLVVDDSEVRVELSQVKLGSIIRIKPGERVPLDGVIVDGTSYLDMSALTGETKEVVVQKGDEVLSGSINGSSVLLVKVTKLESESTVSKVIELVEKASETKAKSEKFISKFSKFYTPSVIVLALIIMFVPPIFSNYTNFTVYAYRALSFLVVSCPCALVISVPLTYFASIGSFARIGIMVKGATHVETLAKVDSVIFDKTGTLTEGNFEISEIFATEGHSEDEILETVAYAESFSNHRIAKSVLKCYYEKNNNKAINNAFIENYTEFAGKGISADIFSSKVLVGNAKLFEEKEVTIYPVKKAGTVLYVSIGGKYAGYVVIEDTIKKDSELAVKSLKDLKINDISICTGDEEGVAVAVAEKLGLTSYYSSLMPAGKVEIIKNKINEGKTVAFVGDGINDAPSLAGANVGISMGGLGSDIAVEASDVVLMTDEPKKVASAIKKARRTRRIVFENIFGTIAIKFAILVLLGFGFAGMWLAVFADVGVTMLAILNALRAMLKKS